MIGSCLDLSRRKRPRGAKIARDGKEEKIKESRGQCCRKREKGKMGGGGKELNMRREGRIVDEKPR